MLMEMKKNAEIEAARYRTPSSIILQIGYNHTNNWMAWYWHPALILNNGYKIVYMILPYFVNSIDAVLNTWHWPLARPEVLMDIPARSVEVALNKERGHGVSRCLKHQGGFDLAKST